MQKLESQMEKRLENYTENPDEKIALQKTMQQYANLVDLEACG